MKALVLSGGKGTRLRPITHTSAKQLVPVANKPILYYAIEAIRDAGITEIGIIVGETHEEIRAACNDGSDWGCKITYIPQDAPLGLAHAVKIAEPFIGKDSFVMYLGDNLIKDGITALVEEFESGSYNAQILLAHVRNPKQFGVAELDPKTGGVVKLEEKPAKPKTDLALVGVYMFDSSVFTAVNAIKPSTRGELEITEAIQYLIDNDYSVHSHVIEGYWKDTGRLEDMLEANRIILDGLTRKIEGTVDGDSQIIGKVHIESGAKIIDSVVRGPAIIGKDTVIENAYIGPFTSIYHDCVISGSEVEHSIILEGSKIENVGVRIEDSLIGKNVKVGKTDQKPIAYRFMLGDNSEVSIV
jgi:glucose-1-phosphate thymidylyltransferase